VHSIPAVVVVGTLAFVGTMFDNFFAFATQLSLTPRDRYKRVGSAHALAVLALVGLAAGVGSVLIVIPTRWIGVLCLAPWALAVHAWRHRDQPTREQYRRGALTTFTLCLALGGDNLAVWIPLLRANGSMHEILIIVVFALWEAVFILCAQGLASHPRAVAWGTRFGPAFIPWIYFALGILILVECGTFT
jgi:cadmium resistance protein CadD (predicted permease)